MNIIYFLEGFPFTNNWFIKNVTLSDIFNTEKFHSACVFLLTIFSESVSTFHLICDPFKEASMIVSFKPRVEPAHYCHCEEKGICYFSCFCRTRGHCSVSVSVIQIAAATTVFLISIPFGHSLAWKPLCSDCHCVKQSCLNFYSQCTFADIESKVIIEYMKTIPKSWTVTVKCLRVDIYNVWEPQQQLHTIWNMCIKPMNFFKALFIKICA